MRPKARVTAMAFDRIADAAGEMHQHLVAGVVAQGVVDALEVVDVGEQQRQLPTGTAQLHQPQVEVFAERQPVRQPGQRIRIRHAADVAVVAGDALAHAPECPGQFADFVVARARRHPCTVVAGFEFMRGIGQVADRPYQRALQHETGQRTKADQQRQQQADPQQVARADLAEPGT